MQFGHVGIALAIASLDPRPETFVVVGAAQFLPKRRFTDHPGRLGEARLPRHMESQSPVLRRRGSARGRAVRPPGSGDSRSRASSRTWSPTCRPTPASRCCCRSAGGAGRSTCGRTRDTGGARCTSGTIGSPGRGSSRARCSSSWRGATRGSWREARHLLRTRAPGARTPVAAPADPRSRRPCSITRAYIPHGCSPWWARSAHR